MTKATSIPTIRAAILEVLQNAESLAGIKVSDDKEPERVKEWIWIWKVRAKRQFKVVGPQPPPLEESVQVFLRIVAFRGSSEAKPSEERAVEIFEAVEAVLRENTNLSNKVRFQHIEDVEIERITKDKKRGCHVIAVVSAKERI